MCYPRKVPPTLDLFSSYIKNVTMAAQVKILSDIHIVDLGVGMAAALAAKYLAELGATITRVEPPQGDPFYGIYPAYKTWHKRASLDTEAASSPEKLDALLAKADICLLGGEDHPAIDWRRDARAIADKFPSLVVLDLEGYPGGTADNGRPATDLLVQARSGLSWEHYSDRPVPMSFSPTAYGAALRGLAGVFAALYEREGSGKGQVVSTSLFEGALVWVAGLWSDIEKPTPATQFVMPKDPYPLVFRCADGVYIHLVIGAAGSKYKMYQALKIDDPSVKPDDVSMPQPGDPRKFFGDIDVLAEHVAKFNSDELLERIWALGLPAEPVLPPGGCWDMPQVEHNGVIEQDGDGNRHVGYPLAAQTVSAEKRVPEVKGNQPLSGVRVVDMGMFVAGPYASIVLGDLGAEVVKIEAPGTDPNRTIFRSYSPCNRGKRAITVNMKDPKGLEIAKALCVNSDIVTSNFRTGVSKRIGVDPDSLHQEKPHLVVLESPGYGSSGPLAERAAFDMVFQALCGHEYRAGGEGNPPLWNRTSMVDYTGGLLGALACVAALYHSAHTGEGMTLDSPLLNAGVYLCSDVIQKATGEFLGADILNHETTGYKPSEALYQANDGWIALVARGEKAQSGLGQALNIDLPADAGQWGEPEQKQIQGAISRLSTDDAISALEAAGVWAEVCRKDMELPVLQSEEMLKANVVQVSTHPKLGRVREIGAMMRFSRSSAGHNGHAQLPGESTRSLLKDLGKSEQEIEALIEQKAVF
jgi:crotonobetainyl-CoA:carnitine CoA-transferase CaiB-like acyl-CoA transferase